MVKMTDSRTVLDAMRVMSEEGVSSLAVVDEMTGGLVGAVSVVDVGKVSPETVDIFGGGEVGRDADLCFSFRFVSS